MKTAFFSRLLYTAPLCFIAGCLAALAMAPLSLWPILFICLPALYLSLETVTKKRYAFVLGWLFGFGYFLCSLSWIGNALLVEGNPYKWAWPLAVSGLPATLAFFFGFACMPAAHLNMKKLSGFAGLIAALALTEWLRGHLFTGFPWNLFAYSWVKILPLAQISAFGTIYTLNILTLLWAFTPGYLLSAQSKTHSLLILTVSILTIALSYGAGAWRLSESPPAYNNDIEIALIQPNITQEEKWNSAKAASHFAKLLYLSRNDQGSEKSTYIIWPETAIQDWFIKDKGSLNAIREMLSTYPGGAYLLTGILRYFPETQTYRNSLIMMDSAGNILNAYDKHHLVPFGEYIPYQDHIPLRPVVEFTGFEKGSGLQTQLTPEGLRYSALVCYEILFPGASVASGNPADFIVNVTNDAWYGRSAGPHQHFTKAVFRAIENNTPVLRAANTGISGIIDSKGRIVKKTLLFKEKKIVTTLPQKN